MDNCWESTYLSAETHVSEIYCLRQSFMGMDNLQVITLSLTYQCGIVVYLQGIEIYRDNVLEGPIIESSGATGCFHTSRNHMITRNCKDCTYSTNVLAIMLLAQKDSYFFLNTTEVWLAPRDTDIIVEPHALHSCHSIIDNFGFSSSIPNVMNLYDFNYLSAYTADLENATSFQLFANNHDYLVNGILFTNLNHTLKLPLKFALYGYHSDGWEYIGVSYQGAYYNNSHVISLFPFATQLYQAYQVIVLSSESSVLEITEVRLLACNLEQPISLELNTYSINAIMYVDLVEVFPLYYGFQNCAVKPKLPHGLSFDESTCTVTGRTDTEFSTLFTMTAKNVFSYSTAFHITSQKCQGMVVLLKRTYGENPSLETYYVTNTITGEKIYEENANTYQHAFSTREIRFCLPPSHYAITMNHENSMMWNCNSFISVSIILVNDTTIMLTKGRFDKKIGLHPIIYFSTHLIIQPDDDWHYYLGSIPSSTWMHTFHSEWPESPSTLITFSPIQLLQKSISISNLTSIYSFQIFIRYQAGCIIYVNGYEIFRRFLGDESVSNSSAEIGSHQDIIYRVISFSRFLVYDNITTPLLQEGVNIISIALVSQHTPQQKPFDCAIRLGYSQHRLLLFDYDIEIHGFDNNVDILFDLCSTTFFNYVGSPHNYLVIRFKDDRREWASMVDILSLVGPDEKPTSLIIEGMNPEDDDWTLLLDIHDMYWWSKGVFKMLYLLPNIPYNMFRIRDLVSESNSWSLRSLLFYQHALTSYQLPIVTYSTVKGYIGYPFVEQYPNTPYCSNYQLLTSLPQGLFFDTATGVFGGYAADVFSGTIQVVAYYLGQFKVTTFISFNFSYCNKDHSILFMNIYSESYSNNEYLTLYEGKTQQKRLWSFTCPTSSQYYYSFTLCLPIGIYNFIPNSIDTNGWSFPAGYSISLAHPNNIVSIGHVANNNNSAISIFTSLDPFPADALCKYIVDDLFPGKWIRRDFDDHGWEESYLSQLPSTINSSLIIRYTLHIPSLTDYHVIGVRVTYNTCFKAYFNTNRIARVGLNEKDDISEYCDSQSVYTKQMTFYILIAETGGQVGSNLLCFEVHQNKNNKSLTFKIEGYFGVDNVDDFYDLVDIKNTDISTYSLLDSDIQSFIRADSKIGNLVNFTITNLDGQPFNSLSIYCDNSIPQYSIQFYAKSCFPSQTDHPYYQDNYELIFQKDITSIKDRKKSTFRVKTGMAFFKSFRLIDMFYQVSQSYLLFSGILPSYTASLSNTVCPSCHGFYSVRSGDYSPGPCPANMTGVTTRLCTNGVFGDINYKHCKYIPPYNLTYPSSSYLFYVGIPATTLIPRYSYYVENFNIIQELPKGLHINKTTGEIFGIPDLSASKSEYWVFGTNPDGYDKTNITIEIKLGYCFCPEDQRFLLLNTKEWSFCSVYRIGWGYVRRHCVLIDNLPSLVLDSYCLRFPWLWLSVVIFCCVCIFFILRMIQRQLQVRRILKLSNSLYDRSSYNY